MVWSRTTAAPLTRTKWKGLVILGDEGLVRVGKKAERKARGYWVWISGLLVGEPRAHIQASAPSSWDISSGV